MKKSVKKVRHKWHGQSKGSADHDKGGLLAQCVKCGCVKEFVCGIPTYFIDDTVYDRYTPSCDERNVK